MANKLTPQQRHDRTIGYLESGQFGRFNRSRHFLLQELTEDQTDRLDVVEQIAKKYKTDRSRLLGMAKNGSIAWEDLGAIAWLFDQSEIDVHKWYYAKREILSDRENQQDTYSLLIGDVVPTW